MSQRPFGPFVLIALLTVVCLSAAQARDPNSTNSMQSRLDPQRGNMDTPQQLELQQRQKRRDDLRETLRVQGEEAAANNPSTARQLSAQERIELRQQLRQQQEWLNK